MESASRYQVNFSTMSVSFPAVSKSLVMKLLI